MDLQELRVEKRYLEKDILDLIKKFQKKTDLKVKKIHLDVYLLGNKNSHPDFVNVILKGL